MIVDSSALVAIIFGEPEAERFWPVLRDESCAMSAASFLESAIVIDGREDAELSHKFDQLVESAGVELVPVSAEHAKLARAAYARFGKGHHKAGLNFGDCLSYALAEQRGEPLLYKGDDFAATGLPQL